MNEHTMRGMPECFDGRGDTTGYMGGDSGHGGNTTVSLETGGGGENLLFITMHDGREIELNMTDVRYLQIVVCGDWEAQGLYETLLKVVDDLKVLDRSSDER